ncbi:MAG: oxidoreductase [Chitinophagales bacterium]|nr:oxidoreductase [Chitinophagales bacterium]
MKKIHILLISLILLSLSGFRYRPDPKVQVLTSGTNTSLRGLSVVNDNIVWVSGSNGMVGRSSNAGKNWKWTTVKGFEKKEFRDIEAFDASTAIIMAVDTPAVILKTTDGGETWKTVYENKTPGMFLDAMHFLDQNTGMVIGDPINKKVFIAATQDAGESWQEWEESQRPVADSGEAFFAASGTNIRLFEKNKYFMVSGGTRSRLFTNNNVIDMPIIQGKETTGANSVAVFDEGKLKGSKRIVVVGGDFMTPGESKQNCYYTTDGGKSWNAPSTPPHGYRSCVEYLSKTDLVSCGLNGVDYSYNGGKTWKWISKESFHVVRIAKMGTTIFLAGNKGQIGKLILD